MDYENFTPTYAYRHILADEMNLGADEYWTPKILRTHLKIKKLYDVMYGELMTRGMKPRENYELFDKVIDLKSKVGIWITELIPTSGYRRRNLITNSEWETVHHKDFFPGTPYELWLQEGMMIVLPSKETIEWLNHLAYLFRVSNKETV